MAVVFSSNMSKLLVNSFVAHQVCNIMEIFYQNSSNPIAIAATYTSKHE